MLPITKRRRFVGAPRKATRFVSAEFQGRHAWVAANRPLRRVCERAVERSRRRAPTLSFQADLQPTLVQGEGERIARAVTNLLDNAMKWSPAGGIVEVALRDGVLTVRDHGPGFHEEDLPFVFDRFYRGESSVGTDGTGLGLSIVRRGVERSDGTVTITSTGSGLRIVLVFASVEPDS